VRRACSPIIPTIVTDARVTSRAVTGEARICLASASPRRQELLAQIGIAHVVAPADIDERRHDGEAPEAYVRRMALEKAQRIAADPAASRGLPVLGADTSVVVDGLVLGKPVDAADGCAMLARLAGRSHEVLSAVTIVTTAGARSALSRTEVRFRPIAAAEAQAYWDSGEPRDKAGGYAIQGRAAAFVAGLAGSYSGVVGLPLYETAQLLAAVGLAPWHGAPQPSAPGGILPGAHAAGQPTNGGEA
jgi:septum formation protein